MISKFLTLLPLLTLPLLTLIGACNANAPLDASPDDLREADIAFARDTHSRGLDGWMSWFTDDAVRLTIGEPDVVQGKAGIRISDGAMFAAGDLQLRWTPEQAGLFEGGASGFTSGAYTMVRFVQGGEQVVGTGHYLSLWRHTDEGWRVYLDTGTQDPPAAPTGDQ